MSSTRILLAERLVAIAVAGGLGAMARYLLSRWVMVVSGGSFPFGTLVVNVAGCGLFGLCWGLADVRGIMPEKIRLFLLVGFLGAFTTFSSYAYETLVLLRERHLLHACLNIIVQNIAGLAAVAAGYQAIRLWS